MFAKRIVESKDDFATKRLKILIRVKVMIQNKKYAFKIFVLCKTHIFLQPLTQKRWVCSTPLCGFSQKTQQRFTVERYFQAHKVVIKFSQHFF